MDADHVLRTTRSVRLRLDFERPIDPAVIEECLEVALQAPTASNSQQWQWVVITDPDKISAVADIYRKSFQVLTDRPPEQRPAYGPDDSRTHQSEKVTRSAMYLAAEMHRCPAMLIACINGRIEQLPAMAHAGVYGSILPGAWSFMLAARERGIGMAWTTIHLRNEADVAAVLGIPDDVTQTVLFPMAYFTGEDFKPAPRVPLSEVVHWNAWGQRTP